jgi:hypothetical protein
MISRSLRATGGQRVCGMIGHISMAGSSMRTPKVDSMASKSTCVDSSFMPMSYLCLSQYHDVSRYLPIPNNMESSHPYPMVPRVDRCYWAVQHCRVDSHGGRASIKETETALFITQKPILALEPSCPLILYLPRLGLLPSINQHHLLPPKIPPLRLLLPRQIQWPRL